MTGQSTAQLLWAVAGDTNMNPLCHIIPSIQLSDGVLTPLVSTGGANAQPQADAYTPLVMHDTYADFTRMNEAAAALPALCLSQRAGSTGSQLIGRHFEACTKQKKGSMLKVSEAWGGKLLSGDDIYACVTKDNEVLYNATDSAKGLKCGGREHAQKITLGLHFKHAMPGVPYAN